MSLVSSCPRHRFACHVSSCRFVLQFHKRQMKRPTPRMSTPKKNTAPGLQHGPGQEPGSRQRRRGWPSLAPYPREAEHAAKMFWIYRAPRSSNAQTTMKDAQQTLRFRFQRTPQKKALRVTRRRAIQFYSHENDIKLVTQLFAGWLEPLSSDHTSNHFLFFQTAKRRDHKSVVRDDQRRV